MDMFESKPVVRWRGEEGAARQERDDLATEEPLEIRVRGRAVTVMMRTPGHDEELAAGFLLSEGLIHKRSDILRMEPCERNDFGNLLNVVLNPLVPVDFEKLTRHVFAASSCGLCGKATIEAIRGAFAPLHAADGFQMDAKTIAEFPEMMRKTQETFERTGGLHAAALFDEHGELLVVREDIGRHNAVDKVLGYAFLNHLTPLGRHVLLVSGRSSFEIMQKALAGRVPILAAVSAPSALAVEFAKENEQTLIGFLRGQRMNVYTGAQRIKF